MTTRRVSITIDPDLCRPGLDALRRLASEGAAELQEAIRAMEQVCRPRKPPNDKWREVPVHKIVDYDPQICGGLMSTPCGMSLLTWDTLSKHSRALAEAQEAHTTVGNIVELTACDELVTCERCKQKVRR